MFISVQKWLGKLMENCEHMINSELKCSAANATCSDAAYNIVILGVNTLFYVLIHRNYSEIVVLKM